MGFGLKSRLSFLAAQDSLFHGLDTNSRAHRASYPMDMGGGQTPGVK